MLNRLDTQSTSSMVTLRLPSYSLPQRMQCSLSHEIIHRQRRDIGVCLKYCSPVLHGVEVAIDILTSDVTAKDYPQHVRHTDRGNAL
jgi:hypothetical protein